MSEVKSKVVGLINFAGDEDRLPPWGLLDHEEECESSHLVSQEIPCNQSQLVLDLNREFNRFRSQLFITRER